MRILKIIHGYPPNYNAGSEVYTQSICEELSKENEVFVFTREENPYAPDFTIRTQKLKENLTLFFVNMAQGKDGFRHREIDSQFAELLDNIKPDIAHIGHLNHLSTGIIDELNRKQIPVVFTLHDFWLMCPRGQFLQRNSDGEKVWQLCDKQENCKCASICYKPLHSGYTSSFDNMLSYEFEHKIPCRKDVLNDQQYWENWIDARMDETRSVINKVDAFIAPSHYLRNRFIAEFNVPENKLTYLDYGFPTHYLTPTYNRKRNKHFTFGYIGTHVPSKGINLLIEAFKKLEGDAELLIWGSKAQQSTIALMEIAGEYNLSIQFKGEYINKNLADEVFSQVDCIVVPSIWGENSPLVIHEAQSCRVPVITADFGGMKEYVQHHLNGLLFEHRNIYSLAEQLRFAVENPNLMKGLGQRGYLYSEDGNVPDIHNHCKELEKIYRQFIPSKNLWRITIDTNPEDCNLKCVMCEEHSPYSKFIPSLFKETGVKRRRMKFADVEEVFHQAEKLGVKEIIPSTMGEPLLYKEFDKIFELAEQTKIKINLTTNGTFPKKTVQEWAKLIVPNTIDIKISWNGATEETAQKVMIGIDFNQAIENVKSFIKFRDEHFAKTGYFCRVTFQLTFMQNNMHELAEIIKLAASLGVDRVKGHQLWAHFEEIKNLSMKANQESVMQWNVFVKQAIDAQEKFRKPNGEKVILENIIPLHDNETKELPEEYECPFLTKELWVSATGNISPCCAPDNLRKSLGDFGNISTTSIEDVLKGFVYMELVSKYKMKPICKTCNMRKPISL
jgi:glycosyltransferase involved in cell wall biosynthesis/MoaA/NifB/PqqE/SkfB family radical SAM enzyme